MAKAPAKPPASARPRISPFTAITFLAVAVFVTLLLLTGIPNTFNLLLINPLINALIILNKAVFGQFGVAIILFTLLLRLATVPFTIRQFESMKKMQAVQPELKELEKKYKDPRRRQEETMKIYKEMGINPLGCVMPMIIQMVVFIALYRALVFTVGGNPESLVGLSQRLYPISLLKQSVPLNQHFLWLNLGQPDGTYVLPILVAYFTYVQQKLSQTPNATPQQLQQQQMMSWMLPLMLAWFTLALPSGVGVYWVVTNVFSLFASYYVYGRRAFSWRQVLLPLPGPGPAPAPAPAAKSEDTSPQIANEPASNGEQPDSAAPRDKVRAAHGKRRGKRKNSR